MKRFLLMLLLLVPLSTSATTWYVRTDGSNKTNCTGTTDAPYSGSGTNQPCGVGDIKYLTTSSGWITAANDTIQFSKTTGGADGPYYVGNKLGSGPGTNWNFLDPSNCPTSGAAPNCVLPALPNGTHLWGANKGSCTNPFTSATRLIAINAVFEVLDIQGSQDVDIQCILITQVDDCTHVVAAGQCASGTNNYGEHGLRMQFGTAQGPARFNIQDFAVVGMAQQCILGSKLNLLGSDASVMHNTYLIACGLAGWDWDGGGCGTSCQSVGSLDMQVDIEFNGCSAVMPFTTQASILADHCAGQTTGGYGDGLGIGVPSSNFALTIHDSRFAYNVQDGPDTLHMGDLPGNTSSVTLLRNWSVGNGGQAFKHGAVQTFFAADNVAIVNCAVLNQNTVAPMSGWPSSYNTNLSNGDLCRASDQWTINIQNGGTYTYNHNTTAGYNTTMWDFECASGVTTCTTGTKMIFKNNLNIAYGNPLNSNIFASGIYLNAIPDVFANTGSALTNNSWYQMHNGCSQDAVEPTPICTNPTLANQAVNSIDPHLLPGSPVIGAGVTTSTTTDYYLNAFASPPSIGAVEASTPPTPAAVTIQGTVTLRGVTIQ